MKLCPSCLPRHPHRVGNVLQVYVDKVCARKLDFASAGSTSERGIFAASTTFTKWPSTDSCQYCRHGTMPESTSALQEPLQSGPSRWTVVEIESLQPVQTDVRHLSASTDSEERANTKKAHYNIVFVLERSMGTDSKTFCWISDRTSHVT
ncbi:hypothetical protein OE88DRAFT_1046887 [Heliocybe sulcata]|uniref:Uncharacterized protein n=1 Tax=Heliocybe sulcata TaxID=5364 RepID=A0A5C3MKV9_9AGAM|nr:hypothetical protein OE88DRAFT_1046887 [Heliocybe sulcata]